MKKMILLVCLLLMVSALLSGVSAKNNNFRLPTKTPTPVYSYGKVTWKCVDATSYDGNAYNDNKCTSSTGQVRFVSDSEAKRLDPSYKPGKSGAWYYNNK